MRLSWLTAAALLALVAGCTADHAHVQDRTSPTSMPFAQAAPVHSPAPSGLDLMLQAIGGHRIALLGEMHGTHEIPALAGQLVTHYAAAHVPVLLGLEINPDEQADVDRFLGSNGDVHARDALLAGTQWLAPFDGRDSEAMFGLIEHVRQLRGSGADIRIVYFDAHDPDMDARNRRMADILRAAAAQDPGAMLLVLTGNVHAMTHRPPGDLYSNGRRIEPPMTAGRYLSDLNPVSIDVSAASGEYSACIRRDCGPRAVPERGPRASPSLQTQSPSESAWDFSLTLPQFHVSPSAVSRQLP